MIKTRDTKKCLALACGKHVGMKRFMCPSHWAIVPFDLKKAVLDAYVVGQFNSGRITPKFRIAISDIVKHVAFREGVLVPIEQEEERDDGRGGEDDYSNGD